MGDILPQVEKIQQVIDCRFYEPMYDENGKEIPIKKEETLIKIDKRMPFN